MAGVAATVRRERAPARQVLATQGRQSPQNVLSSACQLLPRRRPDAAIEAPTSDPGAVQGKGARFWSAEVAGGAACLSVRPFDDVPCSTERLLCVTLSGSRCVRSSRLGPQG